MQRPVEPHGTLARNELRHLNPVQKEQYASNLVLEVLRRNRMPLSISTLEKLTHLNRITIERHLTRLIAIQVVEKETWGIMGKYRLSTRSPSSAEMELDSSEDVFYSIQVMEREGRKLLYVQQKELNELKAVVVKGGITVAFDDFDKFIERLRLYVSAQRGNKLSE